MSIPEIGPEFATTLRIDFGIGSFGIRKLLYHIQLHVYLGIATVDSMGRFK